MSLRLWQVERKSLKDSSKVQQLEERLATRWSIETGILENLYTVDRGVTLTLVKLGLQNIEQFSTTGRLSREAARLIQDQRAALDFLFSYLKEERPLSLSYVKELHQLLLRNQETTDAVDQFGKRFKTRVVKGEWKKLPNNPLTENGEVHQYCPPEFVQDEMEMLLLLHEDHEASGVRPEVEAAWLHHGFTQIHPFQDGNGRVARALATMIFLKAEFLPLVIRNDEHKDHYLNALERADDGDLSSLVNLFANIQAADLENAITEVRELRSGASYREIALAAADAAKRRVQEDEEELARITDALVQITHHRMEEIAFEMRQVFSENQIFLDTFVGKSDSQTESWWTDQIIKAAQHYRYYADLARFRSWVQLRLQIREGGQPRWHIVISLHHKEVRSGVMAAVAVLTSSTPDQSDVRPVIPGSDYEFSFSRSSDTVESDFKNWLEQALQRLLNIWQTRI